VFKMHMLESQTITSTHMRIGSQLFRHCDWKKQARTRQTHQGMSSVSKTARSGVLQRHT
jgi:hypothetical protein